MAHVPEPPDGSFGAALGAAVRGRGLTLDRLRWHLARRGLHVGVSSLSEWQHGRSVPTSAKSLRAVTALEEILRLPSGELSALVPGSRARAVGLDERGSPVEPLLRDVTDTSGAFDILARRCKVYVDASRRASVMRHHTVIRARRDGLDRYVVRYFGDPGCVIDRVAFRRLHNCRLGRVVRRPDPVQPALVAELLFDRPLSAGDTWVFGRETTDGTGVPCTDYGHGFRQAINEFLLEVQFDPAVEPVGVWAFAEDCLDTGRRRLRELTLAGNRTAHVAASDVRSGVRGIAWSWTGTPGR